MRTQICFSGEGPSGLLLGQLLHLSGINTVVLERQSRAHLKGPIGAGVLQNRTCSLLEKAGDGTRLRTEGLVHDGTFSAAAGRQFCIGFQKYTGKSVTVYRQNEVTHDLYEARNAHDGIIIDEAQHTLPYSVIT